MTQNTKQAVRIRQDQIEVTTGDEEPRMMTVEQFLCIYRGK